MGKGKDLTTSEKQKITKLLIEGMSSLEISKELCRDHQTIKTAVENITKLKTWTKEKGFKNLLPQDECKQKQVIVKQPFLTCAQIFEKIGIEGLKKDKKYRIPWELGSVKKKIS